MAVTIEDVLFWCSRFDRTGTLTKRGRSKPPYVISDEYDVQDLAYAALKPLIEDLTREDPTPKVGGTSGRIDLWSPKLGLAIEIKAALSTNRAEEIVRECMERIKLFSGALPLIHPSAFF